jgi:hypothetical protein
MSGATSAEVLGMLLDPPRTRDPYRRDVELLVRPRHDAENATRFVDDSLKRRSIALSGTPVVSAAGGRDAFNRAIMNLQSGNLVVGAAADWEFLHDGTTPWTAEGWAKFSSLSAVPFFKTCDTTAAKGVYLGMNGSGNLLVQMYYASVGNFIVNATSTGAFAVNVASPFRIAWDYSLGSANLVLTVGATSSSHNKSGNVPVSGAPLVAMTLGAVLAWDFRITRGVRTDPFPPRTRALAR